MPRRFVQLLAGAVTAGSALFLAVGASPASARPSVAPPGNETIAQIACVDNAASFSTLCSLLHLTGLDAVAASNAVTLTVFAPTNQAFADLFAANPALPGVLTSSEQADAGYPLLKNVLLYHITDGRRFSNSVFGHHAKRITMLDCGRIVTHPDLTITDQTGRTITVDTPLVNISASNGVVHVINQVMLPTTTGCHSESDGGSSE